MAEDVDRAAGVNRIKGIGGDYVDRSKLAIPPETFGIVDLESDFSLGERFDLVQRLKVAEHLSPMAGPKLVASLARHGDVVLFSAASPGGPGWRISYQRARARIMAGAVHRTWISDVALIQ